MPCPCEPGHHSFSLDDTYMNFDMRESYLTRQSAALSNKAESIIIKNEDYETKTVNVWRSSDSEQVYDIKESDNLPAPAGTNFYESGEYSISDKIDYLNKYTQSLYCPNANLITPYDEGAENDEEHHGFEDADVTLEMDKVGN